MEIHDKENIHVVVNSVSGRRKSDIKPTAVSSDVCNLQRELKRQKVAIAEKDKQLLTFERMLAIANSKIDELQNLELKHRLSEREVKKKLSTKEMLERRQSIALRQVSDQLQIMSRKEDNKKRRDQLKREELQLELEDLEEQYEAEIERVVSEQRYNQTIFDQTLEILKEEISNNTVAHDERIQLLMCDFAKQLKELSGSYTSLEMSGTSINKYALITPIYLYSYFPILKFYSS